MPSDRGEGREYRAWIYAQKEFARLEREVKKWANTRVELRGRGANKAARESQKHQKPVRAVVRNVVRRVTRNQLRG